MATKIFQRGNFVIIEQNAKEQPIPIDNFDYDFVTSDSVKLKDVVESIELNAATAELQKEDGTPIGTELLAKEHFATFIKSTSGGGGGGGTVVVTNNTDPSTATNQTAGNDLLSSIEDLAKVKEDAYFFNTDDVAIEANKIVFPITCTISVVSPPGVIEGVTVATYANMDALVIGFNAGITYYKIAKRSEDSFYVLDGSLTVSENIATAIISFNNAGLPLVARQYFFTALNIGALSSKGVDGISSNDAILSYLKTSNPILEPAISFSYTGSTPVNLTVNPDINGNTIAIDTIADIQVFATNNNVSYRFDGGTSFLPARSYPRTRNNFSTEIKNVNLNLFTIAGEANNARVAIVVHAHKK